MRPNRPHDTQHGQPDLESTYHCKHFGTCGGCSRLDQPIRWQIADKAAACEQLLQPYLDGKSIQWREPQRTPRWFRTRLLYPVQVDREKLPRIGLYGFRTNDLVRIEECQTMDPWLTGFGKEAEAVLRDLKLAAYRPRSGKGFVKAVWARIASGTGEVIAGIVTRPGVFAQGQELADRFLEAARRLATGRAQRHLVGVIHSISDREDDFMLGDRHVPLRGRDHIVDRRDDMTLRISAGSFYQIHAGAFDLLYREAIAMCGEFRDQRVIDGYGGVGAFGLRFAKAGAGAVTIVEENAAACRDAEHNAVANGMTNVSVERAPFAKSKFAAAPDLLVVDPPRSGLRDNGIKRVLAAKAQRVLHVACDAESLARDLEGLTAGGYSVREMRLCDLFPHTEHVELVTLLDAR